MFDVNRNRPIQHNITPPKKITHPNKLIGYNRNINNYVEWKWGNYHQSPLQNFVSRVYYIVKFYQKLFVLYCTFDSAINKYYVTFLTMFHAILSFPLSTICALKSLINHTWCGCFCVYIFCSSIFHPSILLQISYVIMMRALLISVQSLLLLHFRYLWWISNFGRFLSLTQLDLSNSYFGG